MVEGEGEGGRGGGRLHYPRLILSGALRHMVVGGGWKFKGENCRRVREGEGKVNSKWSTSAYGIVWFVEI